MNVVAMERGSPVNLTGISPKEFKVLVLPDEVSEFFEGTTIRKPVETEEKQKWATTEGVVIDVSPAAFSFLEAGPEREAGSVKPGQRVSYALYAGKRVKSKRDGKEYLIVNDKDILCVIEE